MFCQKCGSELKEEQTFCRVCGEQVSWSQITLPESGLLKRASTFSLGVVGVLIFLFLYILARRAFFLSDNLIFIVLFFATFIFSGITASLLIEMKEIKKAVKKVKGKRQLEIPYKEPRQIEEKPFIPASWSVTDTTTENLFTKKKITGDL